MHTHQFSTYTWVFTVLISVIIFSAYVDSNSEDSDSDMSDVGELDSDVESEKQKTYERAVYKEDMLALKKAMKSEMRPGEKRAKAPNEGLKLQFVHG